MNDVGATCTYMPPNDKMNVILAEYNTK